GAGAGLVGLEDQRRAVAALGEVAVEAIDRQVELTVGVPCDVEIVVIERPVAGLSREFVPGQAPRLVKPEAVGIGPLKIVKLLKLARADPRVEIVGNGMDARTHRPRLMSITKR